MPPATTPPAPGNTVPMLDFSRQFKDHREELLTALTAVCDSQQFILGPQVAAFEAAAALACATPHAIGCASGTDALWLALAAANIGTARSHAVITTPFSFFASASSILRAGARPLFADIDPLTFNLSPDRTRELLARTTSQGSSHPLDVRAILPVHLYGQCADFDGFTAIQLAHPGLLLIEDAAQAFGATWDNLPAGALGDAAAFSFYPTKNLAAFGDAGLMTTRSTALDIHARSLRAHGMTHRYFHDEVGWNSRLDSLQAAVLLAKLPHLPAWNQRRRTLAARYNQLFLASSPAIATLTTPENPHTTADGIVLPYVPPRAQPIFHQYVIRAPRRDALRAHLTAHGIGSEIYYPLPLHLQPALAHLGYRPGDLPEAERAAGEVLALPIFPELREQEQELVVDTIRRFYA